MDVPWSEKPYGSKRWSRSTIPPHEYTTLGT